MKIYKDGDIGVALSPERGRVPIAYSYRDMRLDSGVVVKNVLVGVDAETDEILVVPAQSTPKIKAARDTTKEKVLSVRIPYELDDMLGVVSDYLNTSQSKFTPVLLRYYLSAAFDNAALARRLSKLSQSELAQIPCGSSLKLRSESGFVDALKDLGTKYSITATDAIRGAVLAAFEDVVENRAVHRAKELRSIAAAV